MGLSPLEVDGKRVALLLISETENGETEMAVVSGVATYDGRNLTIDLGQDKPPFVVPESGLERINRVKKKGVKRIFDNCDYYIPLTVGPLPLNADTSEYEFTGLVWPKEASTDTE